MMGSLEPLLGCLRAAVAVTGTTLGCPPGVGAELPAAAFPSAGTGSVPGCSPQEAAPPAPPAPIPGEISALSEGPCSSETVLWGLVWFEAFCDPSFRENREV